MTILYVDVFLSLSGAVIHNNGYVAINDIGSSDNAALLCNTNRPPRFGIYSGGNWYGPDGTIVDGTDVPGVTRKRGLFVVRLKRTTTGTAQKGIYWCSVLDAASTLQTVFVGLYNTGRGNVWFLNVHYTGTLYTQGI